MDLKKQKPSDRIETDTHANRSGKGSNMIYKSKVMKEALSEVSQQFQDSIRGKGDRQNGPDSPMTGLIKRSIKDKNIFRKK